MNDKDFNQQLADIENDILLQAETSENAFSPAEVRDWTNRFPQFESEIIEFAATEAELDALPDKPASPEFDRQFAVRSQQVLTEILTRQQARNSAAITSLKDAAAARNLKFPELADRAGMSLQLLISLEQRMVQTASITRTAKSRLAAALKTSVETLTAYFELPPQLIAGTSYKSGDQPTVGAQQDFTQLVNQDAKLTAAQKRALLD